MKAHAGGLIPNLCDTRQIELYLHQRPAPVPREVAACDRQPPFRHLTGTLADHLRFCIDDMFDFVQAGHGADPHTNNRPKYLIHFDFELGLNPCCIANGKQFDTPRTGTIATLSNLKWLILFRSTFSALDCRALIKRLTCALRRNTLGR